MQAPKTFAHELLHWMLAREGLNNDHGGERDGWYEAAERVGKEYMRTDTWKEETGRSNQIVF